MSEQSLTIKDDRTGKSYTLPIESGTVRAMDFRQIKTDADDFGLMTYDPALMNTASTKSAITFIDGDKGILEYRGYPVEQLAERCTFLSRLPDSFWRAAKRGAVGGVDLRHHASHLRA
jgi:citrate synthase